MRAVRHSAEGPHLSGHRGSKVYRGSRKRIQRIKWRENTSIQFWLFVVFLLLLLFVGIPWMIKHPIEHHHEPTGAATVRP
jgi:hypothetical protein